MHGPFNLDHAVCSLVTTLDDTGFHGFLQNIAHFIIEHLIIMSHVCDKMI